MALGSVGGAAIGGIVGAPSGPGALLSGAAGATIGAGVGLVGGQALTNALFSDDAGSGGGGSAEDARHNLPGEGDGWTKLRGNQGWRDQNGNIWTKDMKHKDHWDVQDRRGRRVMEVDFEGRQIWPGGPKNRNRTP